MMNKVEMNDEMMKLVNGGSITDVFIDAGSSIVKTLTGSDIDDNDKQNMKDDANNVVETAENTVKACLTIFKSWF